MKLTYRGIKYNNRNDASQATFKVSGKYRGNSTVVIVAEDVHTHFTSV